MIGRLRGIILEKQPSQVLLETHGVGYEIAMPITCFQTLPEPGQEVIIYTHCIVRDYTNLLFGFTHKHKLILFRELIKVSCIGPKLALIILSNMSAQQFISTIIRKETTMLVKLPGIGKKTAERLILEMKDKLQVLSKNFFILQDLNNILTTIDHQVNNDNPDNQAILALVALGYKLQEANLLVRKVTRAGVNCEILIRDALHTTL